MKARISIQCLGSIFFLMSCLRQENKMVVSAGSITESVYASGIIKAVNQYQVFSTVSGLVQKKFVAVGDSVSRNMPLLRIAGQTSLINQQSALLDFKYRQEMSAGESLRDLKVQIDFAKTKMENDSILFERQKNLWKNFSGTRNDLEQRELASKNSTAAYHSLLLKYKDLQKQLKYNENHSVKNLEITNALANEYVVKSEINGIVYDLFKEHGELVTPQSPIAIIGDINSFLIELQVDEIDISKIKLGQQVFIKMESYKESLFTAKISRIRPLMNEATRSFVVEAIFLSKPKVLYPNLTVEANILIETKQNVLTIPRSFVLDDKYVILANHKQKEIKVGLKDYERIEVIDGLKSGDVILKPKP